MPETYVYDFDADAPGGRELLGGKGIGLAEMTRMGVSVPAGFTITTDACRAFMAARELPAGLAEEVDEHVRRLEATTGKRFGSSDDPLLVSVRSGAAVSMPGMMDTILNLGLNGRTVEALAKQSSNRRFAYDSYRRFIQMYGDVVFGLSAPVGQVDPFERVLDIARRRRKVKRDVDLDPDDLVTVVGKFREIVERGSSRPFPDDPWTQLWGAVEAVFRSWQTKRAVDYRRVHNIPDNIGTAVNIVAMVHGN